MIYLDTSALVKLIFDETESAALAEWLTVTAEIPKVSSDLATIERVATVIPVRGGRVKVAGCVAASPAGLVTAGSRCIA